MTAPGQPAVLPAEDVAALLFTVADHVERRRLGPSASAAALRRAAVRVVREADARAADLAVHGGTQ